MGEGGPGALEVTTGVSTGALSARGPGDRPNVQIGTDPDRVLFLDQATCRNEKAARPRQDGANA